LYLSGFLFVWRPETREPGSVEYRSWIHRPDRRNSRDVHRRGFWPGGLVFLQKSLIKASSVKKCQAFSKQEPMALPNSGWGDHPAGFFSDRFILRFQGGPPVHRRGREALPRGESLLGHFAGCTLERAKNPGSRCAIDSRGRALSEDLGFFSSPSRDHPRGHESNVGSPNRDKYQAGQKRIRSSQKNHSSFLYLKNGAPVHSKEERLKMESNRCFDGLSSLQTPFPKTFRPNW